jgi:Uma2 family endonuclease
MVESAARRPATYEDVLRAPPDKIAEVIDGDFYLSPRPAFEHAASATFLISDLNGFNRKGGGPKGPGGWWILFEPELHLGAAGAPDILVPDVAGFRRERVPALPKGPFTVLPPDFVCEVLSPSTASRDRVGKMRIYAREGVGHLWLVDPTARTVESYRLQEGRWLLLQSVAGNRTARLEPFDALEMDLERWWGETPDPPELER